MTAAGRWPVNGWVASGFTDFDVALWPSKVNGASVLGGAGWGISPLVLRVRNAAGSDSRKTMARSLSAFAWKWIACAP